MKISKLKKFAWAFFALALTTTTIFAQGWRNLNPAELSHSNGCLEQISGLTEDQTTEIAKLVNIHLKEMEDLRTKHRATTDAIEKNEIRGEMLKNVKAHRESVKNLLSETQQKEYDLLPFRWNNQGNNMRNGQFRGNGRFAGRNGCRGQGYGMGNRRFNRMNYGCQRGNNW